MNEKNSGVGLDKATDLSVSEISEMLTETPSSLGDFECETDVSTFLNTFVKKT